MSVRESHDIALALQHKVRICLHGTRACSLCLIRLSRVLTSAQMSAYMHAATIPFQIEALDTVERAYVHVDYERRSLEEHKVRNWRRGRPGISRVRAHCRAYLCMCGLIVGRVFVNK